MNSGVNFSFAFAASLLLGLSGAAYGQSTSSMSSPNSDNSGSAIGASTQTEKTEAAEMVPARAFLLHKLDAKDDKPGSQFIARLADTVHLKSGTELPRDTELLGTVVIDNMRTEGNSRLALRITKAHLKDGKTIPVKAMIVGIYGPESPYTAPGQEEPNNWTGSMLGVDQLNAMPGVELHSRIAGDNSGVLVTRTKDDVKLAGGSELALAIAQMGHASS